MSHFAKINSDNIVESVIVAEQDFIDSGAVGLASEWVQTSYNTHGGVHSDGGTPLRKNYAEAGDTFDTTRDAFYAPQPYPSWILVEDTCQWNPPTVYPDDDKMYTWDEDTTAWVEVT